MTIKVKSLEICSSCIQKNILPPCGVNTFRKGGELIKILNGNLSGSQLQQYTICPVDAIKLIGQMVKFSNDKCVACGLCINLCPYENIEMKNSIIKEETYNYIKNNILQTASFLRSALDNKFEILTEVKAPGNSRAKRIDIVIINSNRIHIIKVLSNFSSLGKYERSYTEMLIDTKSIQSEIEVIFLYCDESNFIESSFKDINNKDIRFTNISIDKIISYIKGEKECL